jgi:GMP synthase (glutamine-hydrolysing)
MRQEGGFQQVRVKGDEALFNGLTDEITVFQAHYWEVKEVPAGFELAAESDLCRIQAVKSRSKPLFGTQFHAEVNDETHPDGNAIVGRRVTAGAGQEAQVMTSFDKGFGVELT